MLTGVHFVIFAKCVLRQAQRFKKRRGNIITKKVKTLQIWRNYKGLVLWQAVELFGVDIFKFNVARDESYVIYKASLRLPTVHRQNHCIYKIAGINRCIYLRININQKRHIASTKANGHLIVILMQAQAPYSHIIRKFHFFYIWKHILTSLFVFMVHI